MPMNLIIDERTMEVLARIRDDRYSKANASGHARAMLREGRSTGPLLVVSVEERLTAETTIRVDSQVSPEDIRLPDEPLVIDKESFLGEVVDAEFTEPDPPLPPAAPLFDAQPPPARTDDDLPF